MPLTLYRLRDESELTQKWMGNASFAFLAGLRPAILEHTSAPFVDLAHHPVGGG